MARVHGVAVAGTILLGTALWFLLAGEAPAPPAAGDPEPKPAAARPPDAPAAARIEQPSATTPPAGPTAAPPAVQAPPALPAAAAPITVELRVRDLVSHADLASFQWRWRSGDQVQKGEGAAGSASLAIPPGRAELLVECRGYEPCARQDLLVDAAAPQLLQLFLVPVARATGARIRVLDDRSQPVPNLQVACYPLAELQRWQPGDPPALPAAAAAPLWRRRAAAADGVYPLPDLAPGRYTLEALAVDADGALLPALPAYCTFALTGSNAVDEQLLLQPGALLTLELVDAAGNLLDPAARGPIGVRLWRDGDDRPIDWVSTVGARLAAVDGMPAASPIAPRLPLAPGSWQLEVSCGGQLRLSTLLLLRERAAQTERIVVP